MTMPDDFNPNIHDREYWEEPPIDADAEIFAKVRRYIAEEVLLYTHVPAQYLDRAAERIVTFLKVEERQD